MIPQISTLAKGFGLRGAALPHPAVLKWFDVIWWWGVSVVVTRVDWIVAVI